MRMRQEMPSFSKRFGSLPRPIEDAVEFEGKYMWIIDEETYADIRQNLPIRPKRLRTYKDEVMVLLTLPQLEAIYAYWEAELEIGEGMPGDFFFEE